VDKFTKNSYLLNKIKLSANNIKIEFIEKGEKNPAVAAASIVARAVYLESLEQLSKSFLNNEFKLTSGSGTLSNNILKKIVKKYDKNIITNIAKTHFKNVQAILGE
jgi:ribonuclease HIII